MCGILGCTNASSSQIDTAAKTICYRGPDFYGHFCDDKICLGHQRLSIIDLDPRSNQPMTDVSGDFMVVFNGEVYNYKQLKQDLLKTGFVFKTESDTEVLLNAYKHSGLESIKFLQGMFAIGLYDKNNHKIVLARDHAGIKPLYYYNDNGIFAFASEIKALVSLLRQKGIQIEIDLQSLNQFLVFGYIPSPNSLVKGIKKLPKSSYAEFDLQTKDFNISVFKPDYNRIKNLEQFQDLIEKKVMDHLVADVPVGVFFSGGTDSSLIAAILHKYNVKLKTFSIDLGNRDDKYYFEKINTLLNLESQVYNFGHKEMEESYHLVSKNIDEPTFDSSIYPTAFISQKAAKQVKVVLSGEGGDEYFLGYHRQPILNQMSFREEALSRLVFMIGQLLPLRSRRSFYVQTGKILKYPWLYYIASMSPAVESISYEQFIQVIKKFADQISSPVYIDRDLYLENDLLRKIDLATSYSSIEGRVPLLDVDIVKNSELFKNNHLENNQLKSLLKQLLTNYLPKDLVYRKKSGFGLKGDMITQCPELVKDAKAGLSFLQKKKLLPEILVQDLQLKNPGLVYAAASLYSSLKNLGLLSSE